MTPRRKLPFAAFSLALATTLLAGAGAADAARSGRVKSLTVREDDGRAEVILETSAKLQWVTRQLRDGTLILFLPRATFNRAVTDLTFDDGLVESVRPRTDGETPTVEIKPRGQTSYSVTAEDGSVRVTLRAITESAAARAPVEATVEPPGAVPTSERPATGAAAQPTRPTSSPGAAEYRIGPGDVLQVTVFGLSDLDRTVRVQRDGSISLPLLGALRTIGGLTLQEAENHLAALLTERQLVKDPQVSIFVSEYVSRGISIQGAVENPGVYQMIQQRSLLEMLGEAGGLSGGSGQRAGEKIFVLRNDADGRQGRIEIDTELLINQGRAELNIPLLPGDVVLVPFAETNRVYVSGAVFEPGPVEFLSSEGITVLQAITAAGGPSERGNLSNVRIVRKLADGGEERIKVNVKKIQNGKRPDVPLERNDTVIVGEWFL